jgi:anaerobic magnesium-protoporphyrin IX monomethyl ester cyclase
MIVLLHPRSTRPQNRRFPLAVLSLAAMLEDREEYAIVDGNLDADPGGTLERIATESGIELLAVSVMPGPQMVAAVSLCREFRRRHPSVPILWGGYFPSLYTDATLNANYVDLVVRGQGEDAFIGAIEAIRGRRNLYQVPGLSFKDAFGLHVHNPPGALKSPNDLPELPYHRLVSPEKYIARTFLGSRTAVHQASIGCPFRCRFCGVVPLFDGRQKIESPTRTANTLMHLQHRYGINAVQFYDNNFFLREDHTAELCDRMAPLNLRWWCEGRIDILLRYSDATLQKLHDAGATMIFFGAESGSDETLRQMNKQLRAEQTLELAARIRRFGIVPEFSFVVGNPQDPEGDTRQSIEFIRKIKKLNPVSEIIVQHYIPVPHPDGSYGGGDQVRFPGTLEEWATERWVNFVIRTEPNTPWLPQRVKRRIDGFELVVNCRWPTMQDIHLPGWGRVLLQSLSAWRYKLGVYEYPLELEWAQQFMNLRKPRFESL